jgi:cytochrome b561
MLHWAIAALILYNLVSGLLIWDLAKDFFKAHRPFYGIGITSHLSSGLTVLALTVIRIVWRLIHEPPAHSSAMRVWERHSAHIVHFLLYAGMVLMPLTGWSILSAHPPAGSPGAMAAPMLIAGSPMAASKAGGAGTAPGAAGQPPRPKSPPPPPGIWWVIPLPAISPIAEIGREPGGVKPQHALHEEFVEWHEIGGYVMILLLFLHIGGALKHQLVDKEPELERMALRRRTRT